MVDLSRIRDGSTNERSEAHGLAATKGPVRACVEEGGSELPEFEEFCALEWPRLVGALDLYCGDLGVAEELAQEAMLRTYQRWEQVQGMESPGGFTYRVAVNLAKSRWRRRQAELRARRRLAQTNGENPDPADGLAVRTLVAGLPDRQRAALVLRYWIGLPVAEAAHALDVTPLALRSLTHRAVAHLREELGTARGATHER